MYACAHFCCGNLAARASLRHSRVILGRNVSGVFIACVTLVATGVFAICARLSICLALRRVFPAKMQRIV